MNKKKKSAGTEDFSKQYSRNIKIFAILMFLISVLTFVAIISYTAKDETYTELSFTDFFGLIKGNNQVIQKAQATNNWLGLVGAFLSNLLINYTFGYWVIFLPVFGFLWSFSLYKNLRISAKVIKMTIFVFLFSVLLSGTIGSVSKMKWFMGIPKEWIGSIGYFISSVLSNLLGVFGSTLLFLTLIVIIFILGFNIHPETVYNSIKNFYKNIIEKLNGLKLPKADKAQKDAKKEPSPEISQQIDYDENSDSIEPARIIKRTIDFQSGRTDQTQGIIHPFMGKNIVPPAIDKNEEIFIQSDEDEPFQDDAIEHSILSRELRREKFDEPEPEVLKAPVKADENFTQKQIKSVLNIDEQPAQDFQPKIDLANDEDIEVVVHPEAGHEPETDPEPSHDSILSSWIHDQQIDYRMPTINLLKEEEKIIEADKEELNLNGRILKNKLETFKISIDKLEIKPGPVVTQYEIVPAPGIKISKIESLSDDIAMALKAKGIRIIAPIPGKGTVGIEIPNINPSIVSFSSIIKSSKFHNNTLTLPLALGKTISGEVFIADLAKMPHLLIAGATGSGKSVGMNTVICSLLYKMHPKNLKFVMIDPKRVELNQYSRLDKHFMAVSPDINRTIINDPEDAVIVLKALVAEMMLRYEILSSVGQRNIFDYNKKVREGAFKKDKSMVHRTMPFIVVIIDELADLMMVASKEVEAPIIRLAQLARAIGIHLVVATQRPSVDVITGIIKANFPTRIAYQVASRVDSRTILDVMGADKLLGNGDLLFQSGGSPHPMRLQNSFISTDEVENICEFIGNQRGYSQPYLLPTLNDGPASGGAVAREDRDPLFDEAAKMVVNLQQASVSLVQRRLKVGYARAGRIIDELESVGIVGPFDGSKARTVLIESESDLEAII